MSRMNFGAEVSALQGQGIELAKAQPPKFDEARETLNQAEAIVRQRFGPYKVGVDVFTGRNANDLGVVDIREGLYNRSHGGASIDEALVYVDEGIDKIEFSYGALLNVFDDVSDTPRGNNGLLLAVCGHIDGTVNTWFRSVQARQVLTGEIGRGKKASQETLEAQWMIGNGTSDEPGARFYAEVGDNGYWATQTHLLAMRGARVNGGKKQLVNAIKSGLSAIPEMASCVVNDRENVKQMGKTALRLSLESRSRRAALGAVSDYRRF